MAMFEPKIFYKDDMMVPGRLNSWIFWRERFENHDPDYPHFKEKLAENGYVFLQGYIAWRDALQKLFHVSTCPFCNGEGIIYDSYGYYYCMCELLVRKARFEQDTMRDIVQSTWQPYTMDSFKPWTNPGDSALTISDRKKIIEGIKSQIHNWIEFPTSWLMLMGPVGSGKTMMLGVIMSAWRHAALYIEAAHFEDLVFSGLREGDLEKKMNYLKNVPMLVMDDLGIQYASQIVAVKLDQLIQFRAKEEHYQDTITVVATNYAAIELTQRMRIDGVSRGASRFLDGNTLIVPFNPPTKTLIGETSSIDFRGHRRKVDKAKVNNGL